MTRKNVFVLCVGLACTFTAWKLYHNQPGAAAAQAYATAYEEKEEREREDPGLRARYVRERQQYEINLLKDPLTGRLPDGIFERELAFARTLPERRREVSAVNGMLRTTALNSYLPAGPNNIGGRTRAVEYDRRYNGGSNQVIIAGCVSGGIMRSADGGNSWTRVSPENDLHNLTTLAQDPRPGFENTWYAGSGEFIGNTASQVGAPYLGFGLWKSVDNGLTWNKLTVNIANLNVANELTQFDHPFDFNYNIAVNPVNGHVYIASWVFLVKSTDGGATFRAVFQSSNQASGATGQLHVEVAKTGRVYLAVNGAANNDKRGVWYSETGEFGSFQRIAGGQTIGVDSVTGWRGNSTSSESKRIILRLAPSNENIGYVFYENGLSSEDLVPEADLFRFTVNGNSFSWSNRSDNMPDIVGGNLSGSDPLELQDGYNMELAIKPDNPDVVFVGGTNLYRSTDGFSSKTATTWIGGYATNFSYNMYPQSHADQHRLVFAPNNASQAISGNDGGVQETQNIMASTVTWRMLPNYQTLQCYNVAIDPGAGRNNFASGSQDNGVRLRDATGVLGTPPGDSNNHRLLFSADGAYVGISLDNNGTQYLYESLQFGQLWRARLQPSNFQGTEITPNNLTTSTQDGIDEFGEFVTNFRLVTEATDVLYYVNFNRLFRTTSASTVSRSNGWTELTGVAQSINPGNPGGGRNVSIRGLGFSRGPYLPSHSLYIGTTPTTDATGAVTRQGKIFRLDDPRNASAATVPVDITPSGLTGNVQDIAVNPNNDNEIMAVVSNYNAISVWWTRNAKAAQPTWKNAEGNLTVPSFRSCAIVVRKDGNGQPLTEYYVGTSIGLYSTVNLGTVLDGNGSPQWQREGGNLLNYAVVTSLAYRPVDNVMAIGTHGNGIYYTLLGSPDFRPNQVTGIDPITNDRSFIRAVYPTAASSVVQYQTGGATGINRMAVQLMNMNGQVVYREDRGYNNGTVPVGHLAKGVYILHLQSSNNRYRHVQKIVRQ